MPRHIFFKNLDALRFISFFGVFISHLPFKTGIAFLDFMKAQGRLGVDFFFLISGFLITYLLLAEKEENKTISLKNFYLRRTFRIWPIYFLFMIVIVFLSWMMYSEFILLPDTYFYTLFLGNFDRIFNGLETVRYLPGFDVLWSISVEEQFYLLIPLLIYSIRKSKTLLVSLIGVHIITLLYKFLIIQSPMDVDQVYRSLQFHPFSSFDLISFGCIMAVLSSMYKSVIIRISSAIKGRYLALLFIAFIGLNYFVFRSGNIYLESMVLQEFLGVFFGAIVLFTCFNEKAMNFNGILMKQINYLGKISYGLYLFHVPIIKAVKAMTGPMNDVIFALLSLLLTILVSHLSYKYIESYFLRLKKKYEVVVTRS